MHKPPLKWNKMATKKKRKLLAGSETLMRKKASRLLRSEQCCGMIRLLFSIAILSSLESQTVGMSGILTNSKSTRNMTTLQDANCSEGTFGILTDGKLTLKVTTSQGADCSEGFLRLLAPENWTCAGAVQIYHNNNWGNVCDDLWDLEDAKVVCQQLNCGSAKEAVNSSAFGIIPGDIWLTDLQCSGSEKNLTECSPRKWGTENCTRKEGAGVVCTDAPVAQVEKAFNKCTWKYYWEKGDDYCIQAKGLRLADGESKCEGRVEIMYNGSWGTVCDDDWDIEDARVVCNQMNCRAPIETSGEDGNHTKGSDTAAILLSNVQCRGDETVLWGCRSPDWLEQDCHHKEDVWVKCGPPIALPGYNPLRDDFVAVIISIALTVLLIIVTTLLVYQIRRKDEIPLEYYGQHRPGYGDYGIYEDIDYAGVKRLSQISHVSEADSSLAPEEYYADVDGEKGSLKGSLGFRKEYYDDVEGNDMEEINGGGKEGYDDIGSPTEHKWKSAQKPGTEYYDDVDDPDSLKQGITRKPAQNPRNEYYDDIDDPDSLKEGITGEQAQKPEKEYYDDVDDLDLVKEGKLQAGEVKKAGGGDYENVPEHSSALSGRRGLSTGKLQAGEVKKAGGGDYENVPEHSSALSGRRGLSTGTIQAGEVKDASGNDYENVPEHSSVLAGRGGHPTGKLQAGEVKKAGGGDYENVPEHSSALSGRRGLSTGMQQAGEVEEASGRDYENVPEHSSALVGRRGHPTGTTCDLALNPGNEYYDDIDDPDTLKEEEALRAEDVEEASRRDYENVPESSTALLGRKGLPDAPGREK